MPSRDYLTGFASMYRGPDPPIARNGSSTGSDDDAPASH